MADVKALTSGSMSYSGETTDYHAPGIGGNRPILATRNGVVKGKTVALCLAPGKKDPLVINVVSSVSFLAIDENDGITVGQVINSWTMISGNYSAKAKFRTSEPRVHNLRDVLIAHGIPEAKAIQLVPIGKGKIDFKRVNTILQKCVGKIIHIRLKDEEGQKEYRGQFTSSLSKWINPAELEKLSIVGYNEPLSGAAQRYKDNGGKVDKSDGFEDEGDDDDVLDGAEGAEEIEEAEIVPEAAAAEDDADLWGD
ncbi:MAG: hypothetical protein JKY94_16670 [Rhodobacteraceae bacterium]|nr:hypothetical protein [Paracoccaceae bacterium]